MLDNHRAVAVPDSPRPLALAPSVLDDAYRLAVCLGASERIAAVIAAIAVRRVQLGIERAHAPVLRLRILRFVVREMRLAAISASSAAAAWRPQMPGWERMPLDVREALILEVACDLSRDETAVVLGRDSGSVAELRRAARRTLAAAARDPHGEPSTGP